jgi:hypothetical protein
MPKFSGGLPPLLKEPIILHHLRRDVLEQLDAHLNMPTKRALGICLIIIEMHAHQLLVAFICSLHNFYVPKTEPPIFGFLLARQSNSMVHGRCSLLSQYQIHRQMNRKMSYTNINELNPTSN